MQRVGRFSTPLFFSGLLLLVSILLAGHEVPQDVMDGSEDDFQNVFGLFFHTLLSIFST